MVTIYISDCQWEANEAMMQAIKNCMLSNITLAKYDFKHNEMEDAQLLQFTEILGQARHVEMIMLSEWI